MGEYRIERTAVSTLRIWRGAAIFGHLQFRHFDWDSLKPDGWQFYPAFSSRKPSRVLRPDVCSALTKAARLPKHIACALAETVQ